MNEARASGRSRPGLSLGSAVALTGLAVGLFVFSATQDWLEIAVKEGQASADLVASAVGASTIASALSWVVLAAWGALLVTRGWIRRATMLVAVLSSLALVTAVILWGYGARTQAVQTFADVGVTELRASFTWWFWIALLAAIANVPISFLAAISLGTWREMGNRYDAPDSTPSAEAAIDLSSSHDVWRAIDEGRDPTAPPHA